MQLSPFTLLIGANGTGKSNFLRLLKKLSKVQKRTRLEILQGLSNSSDLPRHHSFSKEEQKIVVHNDKGQRYEFTRNAVPDSHHASILTQALPVFPKDTESEPLSELYDVRIFSLNPHKAGESEPLELSPTVKEDGTGIVQVLDSLKTGDREDLFNKIEELFKDYIPEVKKLSFVPVDNAKRLQIRDTNLPNSVLISELSEGMQLALMMITILYQEEKPSLICIEDIDRGLHPKLYQQIVELCFDIAEMEDVQIIATTHNPYLISEFKDHESAVIVVEKTEGKTTFTTLEEKIDGLPHEDMPLGTLWASGLLTAVPQNV